jgi:hypothetical protein
MGPKGGEGYKQALDDLTLQMKEEVLDHTLWRTLFGRGYRACCLDRRRDGDEIIVICHVKCVGCRGNNTQYSNSIRCLEWSGLEFMEKITNNLYFSSSEFESVPLLTRVLFLLSG